jgi:glutamate-1-semialdehyde 2,1-aminomutase
VISAVAIDRLSQREADAFAARNPLSLSAAKDADNWFGGVPFHWMLDWPSPAPLVALSAKDATLTSIDGHVYDDFCLGDTASMFGHSPAPLAEAITAQARQGLSYMLPTERSSELSVLLTATFGLPRWQVTTTASEANRAVIRWCRGMTGRRKVLMFNGCYHGAVDDAFVDLKSGAPQMRASLIGQVNDLRDTSVVVEFNNRDALAAALVGGEVACVLAEPVMTNVGMVRDAPGFLAYLRELCDRTGTLLVFDETHTISSGYGGHSRAHGPMPDIMVIGKSIGGGVPCAVYGFTEAVAERMAAVNAARPAGHSGIGTTLSANALSIAAMHAMLTSVITPGAYQTMAALTQQLVSGLAGVIAHHSLPWHITHVGARIELLCSPVPPANGSEAKAAMQPALEALIHLYLVNRGIILAPFHNMMLVSPVTTPAAIERLVAAVNALASEVMET